MNLTKLYVKTGNQKYPILDYEIIRIRNTLLRCMQKSTDGSRVGYLKKSNVSSVLLI